MCSGNIQNPIFTPPDTDETILSAAEEKHGPGKNNDDETASCADEGKDENELLKEEYSVN